MATKLPRRVGNVLIENSLRASDKEYSDGESENVLLELFRTGDPEKRRQALLAKDPEWRLKYHIAYARENLLNWYDFKKDSHLLEVGAGCGAVTGVFTKSCQQVDALDISPRRSLINAYRNKDADNLRIIVGNIQNLSGRANYDYVTSIGVLEYAGSFINSDSPYEDFLSLLHNQLRPGGTLVLAIENKLGIKYWAGSREDHLGQLYPSIEDYPEDAGVKTFGKLEMEQLLSRAGFHSPVFYYPFPDYKMPMDIYSDDYLPGTEGAISSDLFPTPAPDQPREYLFAEDLAMGSLAKNGLFADFANSFLIFAKRESA